ncbi:hypothetical protein GW750_05120 [bacterium]|nr:hypothetical protein [bacterium]
MHPLQTVSSQYDGRATGVHTAQSFVYDADGFVIEHTSYGEVQEPADN